MKALYLDCFSGISGDMMVGALCDLGVKPSALEWELSKVDIGDFHMHFDRAQRQKIEGIHFSIHEGATHTHEQDEHHHEHEHEHHDHDHAPEAAHDHCHGYEHEHAHVHEQEEAEHEHRKEHVEASAARRPHANDQDHGSEVPGAKARHQEEHSHSHTHGHHHEHAHGHEHTHEHGHECCGHHHHHEVHGRTHRQIRELIQSSDLTPFVKKHALSIFQRIAEAEGKIHGMSVDDVHFHEVGALDSIADIICTCVGLEALGIEKIYLSAMHEGRGWIDCAHGRFPLPAPATMEIFKGVGVPLGETDETHELITPTGAAIAAEFAISSGPMPRMKVEKIGYGIGTRDLASRPNVLRAVIGELE